MNLVLVTEKNIKLFEGLLAESIKLKKDRLIFGAYDEEGYVLGAIACTYLEYEYSIDWLYVIPEARRCKVATALLKCLLNAVNELNMAPVSARFETRQDNNLYEFFISQDDVDVDYLCDRYYVSPKDIWNSRTLSSAREKVKEDTSICFFDASAGMRRMLLEELNNLPDSYEIADYKDWEETCVRDLCRLTVADNKPTGCIFVTARNDGNLWLSYLYSTNSIDMMTLVNSVAERMKDQCPDAMLVFDAVNDMSRKLADSFFPKAVKVNVYEATV